MTLVRFAFQERCRPKRTPHTCLPQFFIGTNFTEGGKYGGGSFQES